MANPLLAPLLRWLSRLSYPRLFLLSAALFLVDLVVPDFVPLADEFVLGLGTLLLAGWNDRRTRRRVDRPRRWPSAIVASTGHRSMPTDRRCWYAGVLPASPGNWCRPCPPRAGRSCPKSEPPVSASTRPPT